MDGGSDLLRGHVQLVTSIDRVFMKLVVMQ